MVKSFALDGSKTWASLGQVQARDANGQWVVGVSGAAELVVGRGIVNDVLT